MSKEAIGQGHIEESRNNAMKANEGQMKYSESLNNLFKTNALTNTIEMCEVFVIIGAHEKVLCKKLSQVFFLISNKERTLIDSIDG